MASEFEIMLWRIQQAEDRAEQAEQERSELLAALERLIENYYYNNRKGLGVGLLVRATNAVAWVKRFRDIGEDVAAT